MPRVCEAIDGKWMTDLLGLFKLMVCMMRMFTIVFSLLAVCVSANIFAAEATLAEGLSKAEFSKEVTLTRGAKKLLGSSADQLFFATKDATVAVTDSAGKLLYTLPDKDSNEVTLKRPESVAVAAGTVYVTDSELNQILMFSTEGKYIGRFGGKKGGLFGTGSSVHTLSNPRSVAVYEGVVHVLDGGSKRILLFGNTGVFLGVLDLRPPAPGKQIKGSANAYKLDTPLDIKVDSQGRIYVLDGGDHLIKVYSAEGEYLRALPEDGALLAFTVAEDGVYVAKKNDFSIQKYDFNDKPLYRFGGSGEARGQIKSLSGMALLKDRQFVVADTAKGVVAYFTADAGVPLEEIPRTASRIFVQSKGETAAVVNKLAWNGKDTIYAVDAEQKALVSIRNGKLEGLVRVKDVVPVAVAFDQKGDAWVLDKKCRVLKLDADKFSFGSEGSGDGQFKDPTDLVISPSGKLYVADKGNDSVQVFDATGKFLSAVRNLDNPWSIAVDAQENLYVLGKGGNSVAVYSAQGVLRSTFGNDKDARTGSLVKPVALMLTDEEVMVLDGDAVKVYSHKGEFLRTFGARGSNPGELDEPVAIAQKDAVTFFIAEAGNKRIQTFVTQYKPRAPQHLAAEGDLHSITLGWDASTLPYISQYHIYRSKDERGGFSRVEKADTNRFIDRGLEADGKYFYRVAAVTRSRYEGASSVAVSAISKKYTPPVLAGVHVEVSAWQIKMSWKAIESEFVSSYFIYQKEGGIFVKIAEVLTPEFAKEGLNPSTPYTFYIAAHSSDGTDAEKFEVTATTAAFSQAPLEIEVLKLRPIFANTYKLYQEDGVGTAKLTNNTNKVMEGVTFSFKVNEFMDFPTESKLDKLLPGKSAEIKLKAVFNNNILNVTEDSAVQALLEASYFDNGKRESYSKSSTINVYEKHKLLWDERERYASFITPKDPPLMSFVRAIVTQYKESKDEAQLAAVLFNALGVYGMTYIPDPKNPYQEISGKTDVVDYIQFPRETLVNKSGDCDDLVAFYTSALESMGITTRVVEVPGHMFMMFSTGMAVEDDAYTMSDMYVIYEDKLWIPVETTVVGSSFVKAWTLGAENYYKWKDKGLTVLDTQQAWQKYKPATLAESKWQASQITRESIDKKFPNEQASMLKLISQPKTRHFMRQIEKNPGDVDAHQQVGIIMAKLGDRQEAMKYFDKALVLQPNNAAALNNRGNLFMIDERYAEAKNAYLDASRASPDDPYIWINLVKAHQALNESKEAKAAFLKAQRLDPGIEKKYKALWLELSNTL